MSQCVLKRNVNRHVQKGKRQFGMGLQGSGSPPSLKSKSTYDRIGENQYGHMYLL